MGLSGLSGVIQAIAVVALILYIVGFAAPYMIEVEYEGNAKVIPSGSNVKLPGTVKMTAHLGILKACKNGDLVVMSIPRKLSGCASDGAADWQKVCFGFSVGSLTFGVVAVVMGFLELFVSKVQGSRKVHIAMIVLNFLTATLITSILVIFVVNKKFAPGAIVEPEMDWDLSWAYFITMASGVLVALLVPLRVAGLVCGKTTARGDIMKEPSVSYIN